MSLIDTTLFILKIVTLLILYFVAVWSTIIIFNYKRNEPISNYFPRITLMAYAWQSGNVIERKILNFLEQDYPRDKMEILIYDNNSTDKTEEVCRKYEIKGLIKYYRSPKQFKSKALVLDEAIKDVATGEFLVLTDPDGICEKEWAKKIVQPFSDNIVGAVVGPIHCGNYFKNLFTKFRAIEDEWATNLVLFGRNGKIKLCKFNLICGANYALRRSAWEDVGKTHGTSIVEDLEMAARLHEKKWIIEVVDANIWQEEVENPKKYLKQRRRWYQFNMGNLIGKTNRLQNFMGLLPLTLESSTFLSFLYVLRFIDVLISDVNLALNLERIATIFPFILGIILLNIGLRKIKRVNLMPYVIPFFLIDGVLQLYCFLETRIRCIFGKSSGWEILSKNGQYHLGTPLKID